MAFRQVKSQCLAEEVAQSVFVELAQSGGEMRPGSVLPAWLRQVTRHKAIDAVRKESRHRLREHAAAELTESHSPSSEWDRIESLLDEAMDSLNEVDRSSILLRYFENKSLREVGEILGATEDATQKRVSRAVERLREFFKRRGVTIGASGLAGLLSTNAVQSAPLVLGPAILTSLFSGAAATAATGTINIIAMTTLQKTLIAALSRQESEPESTKLSAPPSCGSKSTFSSSS